MDLYYLIFTVYSPSGSLKLFFKLRKSKFRRVKFLLVSNLRIRDSTVIIANISFCVSGTLYTCLI